MNFDWVAVLVYIVGNLVGLLICIKLGLIELDAGGKHTRIDWVFVTAYIVGNLVSLLICMKLGIFG